MNFSAARPKNSKFSFVLKKVERRKLLVLDSVPEIKMR